MENTFKDLLLNQRNHIQSLKEELAHTQSGQSFADLYFELTRQKKVYTNMLTGHLDEEPYYKDDEHRHFFYSCIKRVNTGLTDTERVSLFYILGISADIRTHIEKLYDFEKNIILLEGLEQPFHTSGSLALTKIAFSLYNNYCPIDYPTSLLELFCYAEQENIPFIFNGIMLRLSMLTPTLQ